MSPELSFGKVPLDFVREFFCRYVVVEPHQADAIALWIAHTYVFESSRATPYLHFCSPEWGSGKSTALEVIEVLAANAISIDDISGAALFRLIEAKRPRCCSTRSTAFSASERLTSPRIIASC
jgi:hypothetical protein